MLFILYIKVKYIGYFKIIQLLLVIFGRHPIKFNYNKEKIFIITYNLTAKEINLLLLIYFDY